MEGQIFGSNITLPSLPDLQSNCEEEILLLMKEVDLEFHRKHHELLEELVKVRSLCRAQRDEIENLRCIFQGSSKNLEKENSAEKVKQYCQEIERLKKEILELKSENSELKDKVCRLSKTELQLESLKRSLSIEQEENKRLRESLSKADEKNQSMQNDYKKIMANICSSFGQYVKNNEEYQINAASAPDFKKEAISEIIEKFQAEDKEFYNEFSKKMNFTIDELEKKLASEEY